jgi:hypothetical protein
MHDVVLLITGPTRYSFATCDVLAFYRNAPSASPDGTEQVKIMLMMNA